MLVEACRGLDFCVVRRVNGKVPPAIQCVLLSNALSLNRSKSIKTRTHDVWLITRYYDYHIAPSTKSKFSTSQMGNALLWLTSEPSINLPHRRIGQYRGRWLRPYMRYIRSGISFISFMYCWVILRN